MTLAGRKEAQGVACVRVCKRERRVTNDGCQGEMKTDDIRRKNRTRAKHRVRGRPYEVQRSRGVLL